MQSHGKKQDGQKLRVVTLRSVADHVGLTPSTVSAVLNNSAAARSVPEHTKARILAASRELNYRPNYLARSLLHGTACYFRVHFALRGSGR